MPTGWATATSASPENGCTSTAGSTVCSCPRSVVTFAVVVTISAAVACWSAGVLPTILPAESGWSASAACAWSSRPTWAPPACRSNCRSNEAVALTTVSASPARCPSESAAAFSPAASARWTASPSCWEATTMPCRTGASGSIACCPLPTIWARIALFTLSTASLVAKLMAVAWIGSSCSMDHTYRSPAGRRAQRPSGRRGTPRRRRPPLAAARPWPRLRPA